MEEMVGVMNSLIMMNTVKIKRLKISSHKNLISHIHSILLQCTSWALMLSKHALKGGIKNQMEMCTSVFNQHVISKPQTDGNISIVTFCLPQTQWPSFDTHQDCCWLCLLVTCRKLYLFEWKCKKFPNTYKNSILIWNVSLKKNDILMRIKSFYIREKGVLIGSVIIFYQKVTVTLNFCLNKILESIKIVIHVMLKDVFFFFF